MNAGYLSRSHHLSRDQPRYQAADAGSVTGADLQLEGDGEADERALIVGVRGTAHFRF
jgi:hypothetical protein